MKAVVWHGIGDIRLDDVPQPKLKDLTDAIVRLTASAICGTDLHFIRGTMAGMKPGTILGHEGVGVVEELGKDVRNLNIGDRVVIPSTIACGACSYCRAGYYAQCDKANPKGAAAGTAFFGGPELSGPFDGLQAEYARIPFAHVGLVKLPDEVSDAQAILMSDIFPTAYFGADLAGIKPGHTVAVFGCGPVGQFAIASAKLMNAGRIFAIDAVPSRLEMARAQGAETINFNEEHPVDTLMRLTGGIGPDCAIDVVGVDSYHAHQGPAAKLDKAQEGQFQQELAQNNPAGYKPQQGQLGSRRCAFPGIAMGSGSAGKGRNAVHHRRLSADHELVSHRRGHEQEPDHSHGQLQPPQVYSDAGGPGRAGVVDPTLVLTQQEPMTSAIDAYKAFDERKPGWIKVELEPQALAA